MTQIASEQMKLFRKYTYEKKLASFRDRGKVHMRETHGQSEICDVQKKMIKKPKCSVFPEHVKERSEIWLNAPVMRLRRVTKSQFLYGKKTKTTFIFNLFIQ